MSRNTQAIIHTSALRHNFETLQAHAGNSQSLAVIKADAYGHGAIAVAKALQECCSMFAVAILEEALHLREAGVSAPIVILEGPHQATDCALAAKNDCILMIHSDYQIAWLNELTIPHQPAIWLKVDSGMHRLGFSPAQAKTRLQHNPHWIHQGITLASHFACADDIDNPFNLEQLNSFFALAKQFTLPVCLANSAATLTLPDARGDINRLGIGLYGGTPFKHESAQAWGLQPVMTLTSSVIAIHQVPRGDTVGYGRTWQTQRDSIIATVAIGYADGYPRHCPSGTPVWVNGQTAKLVGRVSMDMITIDITDVPTTKVGDNVELWGGNIAVDTVAHYASTISYELLSRVSPRVPRIIQS